MIKERFYQSLIDSVSERKKLLAILVDPDVFDPTQSEDFLNIIPQQTTHLFVGGSSVENGQTEKTVLSLKHFSTLPIFLFPGNQTQLTEKADVLLFLSLLSGRNPEYLIGQQVKAVSRLENTSLEIISMGYLLINGGHVSSVSRISNTVPMPQENIQAIVDTAKAGEYLGKKMIYLEAGSGAKFPVNKTVIQAVKEAITIPLIVGGGIKNEGQKEEAFNAGADMLVMGTAFEKK